MASAISLRSIDISTARRNDRSVTTAGVGLSSCGSIDIKLTSGRRIFPSVQLSRRVTAWSTERARPRTICAEPASSDATIALLSAIVRISISSIFGLPNTNWSLASTRTRTPGSKSFIL